MGIGIILTLITWLLFSIVVIIVYLIRVETLNLLAIRSLEERFGDTYTFDRMVSIKGTQHTVVRLYVGTQHLEIKINAKNGIIEERIISTKE